MRRVRPSAVLPLLRRRGRPRKFDDPSRPVTLTLPVHAIEALAAMDPDLSRAIMHLLEPGLGRRPHAPAELTRYGGRAVIVVNASRALEQRTGIDLVPLPDGRALMSFERSMTPAAIELLIADALDDRQLKGPDRAVFEAIAGILKTARRSGDVRLSQRNIIVLEGTRARRARPRAGSPARKP